MRRALLVTLLVFGASTVCSAQTFYFPHVAVGNFTGGSWRTTIFLSNATGSPARGTITFLHSDGTPFNSTWVDEKGAGASSANVIAFRLDRVRAEGSCLLRTFPSARDSPR